MNGFLPRLPACPSLGGVTPSCLNGVRLDVIHLCLLVAQRVLLGHDTQAATHVPGGDTEAGSSTVAASGGVSPGETHNRSLPSSPTPSTPFEEIELLLGFRLTAVCPWLWDLTSLSLFSSLKEMWTAASRNLSGP